MKQFSSLFYIALIIIFFVIGLLFQMSYVLGVIGCIAVVAFAIYIVVATFRRSSGKPTHKPPKKAIKSVDTKGYIIDQSFYTKVVGVTFNGRQQVLADLKDGMPLDFVREPHNIHDKNAVAIYCSGWEIGHLSREEAAEIAPKMDSGIPVNGYIERITGGGQLTYGCEIRVKIYKRKPEKRSEPRQEIKPTIEIDTSNPLYGKTCVLFGYSYPDEEQNIINLGGLLRRSVSGKTDYYIVRDFHAFDNYFTIETNKVREIMQNGGKLQFLSDEEYSKIKDQYLQK